MSDLEKRLAEAGVFTYPLSVPVSAEDRERLEKTARCLWQIQERNECECPPEECSDESPSCAWRLAHVGLQRIQEILQPVHRSLNPDRLGNLPELIYLRRWQKQNERLSWLNHGYGLLELILAPTRIRRSGWLGSAPTYVPPVSQRDAEVAATVVQFLGTNGGRCFMAEAEKEIEAARMERQELEGIRVNQRLEPVLDLDEAKARTAAAAVIRPDDPKFEELVKQIRAVAEAVRRECKRQENTGTD